MSNNLVRRSFNVGLAAAAITTMLAAAPQAFADSSLLNVSYDPTRELYKAINESFAADWKAKTGDTVTINQSHGAVFHDQRFHHGEDQLG